MRKWIRYCISTVKFSILINGSPSDFFGSSKGLRQGDPLSPLLFDIVMVALLRMLDVAVSTGQFSGFFVGSTTGPSMMVSHLLFTDDTLIFCDDEPSQIANLRVILARFKEVLGLRINLGKFELVPIWLGAQFGGFSWSIGVWAVFFAFEIFGPSIKCKV